MKMLIWTSSLLISAPALAQQAAPKMTIVSVPKGGCRPVTILDPQNSGADKMVEMGCVDGAGNLLPAPVKAGNPAMKTDHYGIVDQHGSTTVGRLDASWSGTHTTPYFANSIEVDEEGSGAASGPERAAYGLGIRNFKKNWQTRARPGEIDGLSLVLRQGEGDVAAILTNVGVRNGFGAAMEGITSSMNPQAVPQKAVRIQAGVVNDRSGGEFGYVASAEVGTNRVGIQVQESPAPLSGSWIYAYANERRGSGYNYLVRAKDGAIRLGYDGAATWLARNPTNRSLDILRYDESAVERVRDSSHSILGDLAIGTLSTPDARLDVEAAGPTPLIARLRGESDVAFQVQRHSADNLASTIDIGKARGNAAAPAAIQAGDPLGSLRFQGYSGSSLATGAQFQAVAVAATPSALNMETEVVAYAAGPRSAKLSEVFRYGVAGGIKQIVSTSVTPDIDRQMAFELTNDTTLTIKVRGKDGVMRKAVLTLAP